MGMILAFVSIKGGVGKTTLALETASSLANNFGKRVLLIDANFSAPNIGLYLNLTSDITLHDALLGLGLHNAIYEAHGFDVVPAALDYKEDVDVLRLRKILSKMKHRYDFIILDSSPAYNEMIPVIAAADKIFLITTPDHVTLETSLKAAHLARRRNTPVEGVIINRIRNPRYELSLKDIEEASEIPVLARIKEHKKLGEALFYNKPITLHKRNNVISKEIRRFTSALCGEPEEGYGFFCGVFSGIIVPKEKINRELVRKDFYQNVL